MKYSIFFSVFSVMSLSVLAQENVSPGDGYVDTESSDPDFFDTDFTYVDSNTNNMYEVSAAPQDIITSGLDNSGAMFQDEPEGKRANNIKRGNRKDDDYEDDDDEEGGISPKVAEMSAGEVSAITHMAAAELANIKDTATNEFQKRILETAEEQLVAMLPEMQDKKLSMQAVDNIAETGVRGSGSCRSASSGKKSKKQGGCEAVLPLNLNYGCWCHADNNDIFKGKGQPVDEFDKACKMYKQCLRCVRLDARNDGVVCDPGSQNYTTTNTRSKDGIHAECSTHNDGECATNTCCCEVDYVRTILKLFMIDGVRLNRKHYHHNFDHDQQCQGIGSGGHEVDCCGAYPTRRMFNTHGKQCCHNNAVYDPYTHVCCDDGEPGRSMAECDNPNRSKRKRRAAERANFYAR